MSGSALPVVRFYPGHDAHPIHPLITGPDVWCAFDANGCSKSMRFAGGFDEHHPWPISMGGASAQHKLILCPNHHRRQHALVRYIVQCTEASVEPDYWGVLVHFVARERDAAELALSDWDDAGRPDINGWPCLAATAA